MKILLLASLFLMSLSTSAQTVVDQAIIITKTTTEMAEDAQMAAPPASGGGEQRVMMFGGGGDDETKTTTWLKKDKIKVLIENSMMRNTIIRDKTTKKTITIMELMGQRRGFYSTEEDEAEMKRKMDSLTGATGKKNNITTIDVEYKDDSKKIAGYSCKKALIKKTDETGKVDTVEVWYTPEVKMAEGFLHGSLKMFGSGNTISGLDKINGFPMQYQSKTRRGTTTVEVTKIDTKKDIEDKVFDVPKDIEIKPMKEMMGGNGGMRFEMRMQR
jgi:GLPGLI family protein